MKDMLGRLVSVNHRDGSFIADASGIGLIGEAPADYNPAPTMNNFQRAIAEWDYHYRASDDPRLYEEGREQEQALIALLKALPAADQHQLQKIVEIVVMSASPK